MTDLAGRLADKKCRSCNQTYPDECRAQKPNGQLCCDRCTHLEVERRDGLSPGYTT